MKSLKETIMSRDDLSSKEADTLISDARKDMYSRLDAGETPDEICMEWFGLEPDYLIDLF